MMNSIDESSDGAAADNTASKNGNTGNQCNVVEGTMSTESIGCCPICLRGCNDNNNNEESEEDDMIMVSGPCGHEFCIPCIERVLTAPSRYERNYLSPHEAALTEDSLLHAPTVGRCPICRSVLSLFDLKKTNTTTSSKLNAAEVDVTVDVAAAAAAAAAAPDATTSNVEIVATDTEVALQSHENHLKTATVFARNYEISKSKLSDMVFVKNHCRVGNESIHFPRVSTSEEDVEMKEEKEKAETEKLITSPAEKLPTKTKPFLNLEKRRNVSSTSTNRTWILDDGSPIPKTKIYFEDDCHFHDNTNTFHGSIRWGYSKEEKKYCCRKRLRGSHQWDYILQFSSDFRFICRGVCFAKKQICNDPTCNEYDCKFPFDGMWEVTFSQPSPSDNNSNNNEQKSTTIQVNGNRFILHNQNNMYNTSPSRTHILKFSGPNSTPTIEWEDENTYVLVEQKSVSTPDHTSGDSSPGGNSSNSILTKPNFPNVGETIEWTLSSSLQSSSYPSTMKWTRETMSNYDVEKSSSNASEVVEVYHFGPDHPGKKNYQRIVTNSSGLYSDNTTTTANRAAHNPDTVWGNTFCQALTVGLASYHFMQDETSGAYISYEHERVAQWPSLDNGMTVPARIWFTDYSFNAETRTFTGTIDWQGTVNTTWQGHRWWRYKMVFSEQFICITKGTVECAPIGSNEERMSEFGESLIYINPGVVMKIRSEVDPSNQLELRRRFTFLSATIRDEMETNDCSTRGIAMIQDVLRSLQSQTISYPSELLG